MARTFSTSAAAGTAEIICIGSNFFTEFVKEVGHIRKAEGAAFLLAANRKGWSRIR
jgi:hypothetical protein